MKIQLLYILDCPYCLKTKKLIKESLKGLRVDAEIKEVLIDTKEKAKRFKFPGSPTVRINGKDVQEKIEKARCLPCEELAELTKTKTSFVKKECYVSGCRTYNYKNRQYPYPPKGLIREAMKNILNEEVKK